MVPIMLRCTHRSDPLARVDILLGHSQLEVRPCRTEAERFVGLDGRPPPKRVAITEWDSLEQAEAFFKSKATDLGLDRDKAINSTDMRSKQ